MKIHQFDPIIYPRLLWVCTTANKDEMLKNFKLNESELEKSLYINGVTTCKTELLSSGKFGVLVFCNNKKQLTISNIAHESVHVADCIFEDIGATGQDFSQGNEPYAYLVGWASECIFNAKNFKL